jgi:hypothetical protein
MMGMLGHVSRMGEQVNTYINLFRNSNGHLEDLGKGGKIILNCILKKLRGSVWTGFIWLSTGTSRDLL